MRLTANNEPEHITMYCTKSYLGECGLSLKCQKEGQLPPDHGWFQETEAQEVNLYIMWDRQLQINP